MIGYANRTGFAICTIVPDRIGHMRITFVDHEGVETLTCHAVAGLRRGT